MKTQNFDRVQILSMPSHDRPGTLHVRIIDPEDVDTTDRDGRDEQGRKILFDAFVTNFCTPTLNGVGGILNWMQETHEASDMDEAHTEHVVPVSVDDSIISHDGVRFI